MSRFSVTIPATDLSLLTIDELRASAGVADSSRDAELAVLGRRVSSAIARRCNVVDDGVNPPTLLRETCTEIFRWKGTGPLRLSRRPVTTIVSVAVDGAALGESGYEIADGRNLYRLESDQVSEWSAAKIIVVYTAGYASAPNDLKLAASKLATSLYTETARDPSLKRENIPGLIEREFWVAPSDDPLLSEEISDLIAPYVERWV